MDTPPVKANTYFRLHLKNIPADREDQVVAFLSEKGSTGFSENLQFVQPDVVYDPQIIEKKWLAMDAFFPKLPAAQLPEDLKTLLQIPHLEYAWIEESHKDWLEEWKKEFKPFLFTDPYWIVPSWMDSPVSNQLTLRIDPGMAFGTGTHATTQMAAYLVKRLSRELDIQKMTLMDLGAGTGVLSILASRLGFYWVDAVENDLEARRVSRENFKANQISNSSVLDKPLEDISELYPVIVANIIDGVLIQLQKSIFKRLAPGGQLIVSGILLEREDVFFKYFIDKNHLQVVQRIQSDEWVSFWLKHAPLLDS